MKNTVQNISLVLIIFLTLFLSSCQVEENILANEAKSSSYKIKSISDREIETNSRIVEKLKKFTSKKNTLTEKNIAFNDLGIIIQTDNANYIENGNYHSYTFATLQTDTENIKNVLFSLNEKGEYDAYLVEYQYNKLELVNFTNNYKPGPATIKPIDLSINSLTSKYASLWICKYDYELVSTGDLVGAENVMSSWVLVASSCSVINANIIGEDSSNTDYGSGTSSHTTTGYMNPSAGGGRGGSIATSPLFSMYDEPEIIKIESVKKHLRINRIPDKLFLEQNGDIAFGLYDYLTVNKFSLESINFGKEIFNLVSSDASVDINAFNFVLNAHTKNKLNTNLDEDFILSVDKYMDADIADIYAKDPDLIIYFGTHHIVKTFRLKALNPQWSFLKCYWEATKDVVHITLDVFGTVPVAGELADITNGVLYLIEGDGVNATFSMAGAVPFYGWAAVSTKYAIKFKVIPKTVYTISTKIKLVWKVSGNTITFGSRSQLRAVLGLGPIALDARQAHHIIPWSKTISNHSVVQKAAKSGNSFHMNEELNGIAVAAWRNQPNHNNYNNLILDKLNRYQQINPNATLNQCYDQLTIILNQAKKAIVDNPNVHLNNLVF
nr:AHH domain-containing protein [uncultured Flavobacterium sp.]